MVIDLGVYRAKKDPKCRLCRGSGDNRSGFMMRVNNHICPRCGGYGIVPSHDGNRGSVTAQDMEYIRNNGIVRRVGPKP